MSIIKFWDSNHDLYRYRIPLRGTKGIILDQRTEEKDILYSIYVADPDLERTKFGMIVIPFSEIIPSRMNDLIQMKLSYMKVSGYI